MRPGRHPDTTLRLIGPPAELRTQPFARTLEICVRTAPPDPDFIGVGGWHRDLSGTSC
ncbi:hypothetical protein [Frankia sp. CiP3]|uniref:hypothetical protein n=1 Tax=Frankia sp. CiP3 TaxID=2880971 RepID=UPI001EF5CF30|nr:hypothetical protein [Frankia sp. CiP3]